MKEKKIYPEQINILVHLGKWTAFIIPLSLLTGSMVALFLWLLDEATQMRWQFPFLIFSLPIIGVIIHFLYKTIGESSERGNNLVIDEARHPDKGVPAIMAPLILITTILTHLGGGSAGREGTAVQIGGSLSSLLNKWFPFNKDEKRIMLLCGMAGGFGAVFGTPVAGAVFAIEVLASGKMNYKALIPCLIAAVFSDAVCSLWGIKHTAYHINYSESSLSYHLHFDWLLLSKIIVAGVVFGLCAWSFSSGVKHIKHYSAQYISKKWMIPVIGSVLVIGISYLLGTFDYLGLGVYSQDENGVSIVNAFHNQQQPLSSWFWKLLLTAITIGMGFKGGEVTPLFFIGATLGNSLAVLSGAPIDLFAGLGLVAVFAGATNTPIACTLMGMELFGSEYVLYFAVACFTAYYFSGHTGIYSSQSFAINKSSGEEMDL